MIRVLPTFTRLALIVSSIIALSLIVVALIYDDYFYALLSTSMICTGYLLIFTLDQRSNTATIWTIFVVLNVLMLYTAIEYELLGFDLYFIFIGMVVAVSARPNTWKFYLPFLVSILFIGTYHIFMQDIGVVSYRRDLSSALHYPLIFGGAFSIILGVWRYQTVIFKSSLEKKRKDENTRDLIQILSHDARSNLASLNAVANHLTNEENPKVDVDFVQAIEESSRKALETLTELLEWLKSENTENETIQLSNMPLAQSIDEAIEAVVSSAELKQISIRCMVDSEQHVLSDSDFLSVIIRNILTNSIKFAPPSRGIIEIRSKVIHKKTVLEISDNGIGISNEIVERFLRGLRVKSSHGTTGEIGTGVGLSIIYNLCVRLNISPKIRNASSGGTIFELEFPNHSPNIPGEL